MSSFSIVLTEAAKALAKKASLTLAEVEAGTRAMFDEEFDGEPEFAYGEPLWGILSGVFTVEMPNGVFFVAYVDDPKLPVEVDAMAEWADGPQIGEETSKWLGIAGRTTFPIGVTRRG